jgi:hypothetical protein
MKLAGRSQCFTMLLSDGASTLEGGRVQIVLEPAVVADRSVEDGTVRSISAEQAESPKPTKKPKRFLASLRFNGLRYLVLGTALLLAWGLVRAAMWVGAGTPEGTLALVLAGGLLAAAAKTAIDILNWAETTRQAAHVERLHAVQRVFQRARAVREQAALDWRRIHTVLVDNLSGQPQEIRLFHDHEETDRQAAALLRKALSEDLWIRGDGVEAVQRFNTEIAALDYNSLATEGEFLAAFNARMESLRRDLALAAIGIPLD